MSQHVDDAPCESPAREIVMEVLRPLGVPAALDRALATAGLDALPEDDEALTDFLANDLAEELDGLVEPGAALRAISEIRATLMSHAESGMRARPGPITAPPPASGEIAEMYNNLSDGKIHTRPTPVWGTKAVADQNERAETSWILISTDQELLAMSEGALPRGVDLVVVASVATLKGALKRSSDTGSAVVLDAAAPSIPIKRTLAALTSHDGKMRVIVWRMPPELRTRLVDAIPQARRWLACDPEVTRDEVIGLLSL